MVKNAYFLEDLGNLEDLVEDLKSLATASKDLLILSNALFSLIKLYKMVLISYNIVFSPFNSLFFRSTGKYSVAIEFIASSNSSSLDFLCI